MTSAGIRRNCLSAKWNLVSGVPNEFPHTTQERLTGKLLDSAGWFEAVYLIKLHT